MALVSDSLTIDQGADWAAVYTYSTQTIDSTGTAGTVTAVDLTGWTARAQIRSRVGSSTIRCTWSSVTTEDPDGPITLTSTGEVILTLTATVTEAMTWYHSGGYWDLVLIDPNGVVVRLVEGDVTLRGGITPVTVTTSSTAGLVAGGVQSTDGTYTGTGGTVLVQRATPVTAVVARIGAPGPAGKDASYTAPLARVAVLDVGEAIPTGLPARTVILRRPASG